MSHGPLPSAERAVLEGASHGLRIEAGQQNLRTNDRSAIVVTKNEAGTIVAVTRQDDDGRILSVIAESAPQPKPLILKGIGKINGDGFKDTTRIGQVVFVWNEELQRPYAPGQYPRVGCRGWAASTDQFDFTPATYEEVMAALGGVE